MQRTHTHFFIHLKSHTNMHEQNAYRLAKERGLEKNPAAPVCMSNNSFLFQSWRLLIGYCVAFEYKLFLLKLHGSVSHKTFIEAKWGFNVSKWTVHLLCAVHLTFCSNAAIRTSMFKQTSHTFSASVFTGRLCALIILIDTLQHYT